MFVRELSDSFTEGTIKFFKSITIEPVVFFYALGFSITIIVSPQLYLEKICTVSLISYLLFIEMIEIIINHPTDQQVSEIVFLF